MVDRGELVSAYNGLLYEPLSGEDLWLKYSINAPRPHTLSEKTSSIVSFGRGVEAALQPQPRTVRKWHRRSTVVDERTGDLAQQQWTSR